MGWLSLKLRSLIPAPCIHCLENVKILDQTGVKLSVFPQPRYQAGVGTDTTYCILILKLAPLHSQTDCLPKVISHHQPTIRKNGRKGQKGTRRGRRVDMIIHPSPRPTHLIICGLVCKLTPPSVSQRLSPYRTSDIPVLLSPTSPSALEAAPKANLGGRNSDKVSVVVIIYHHHSSTITHHSSPIAHHSSTINHQHQPSNINSTI